MSKGSHICFFVGSMKLGGIGRLTLFLMEDFVKKGVQVDLFLLKDGGEYTDQIPSEVNVYVSQGNSIKRIFTYVSYLIRNKPQYSFSARERQDMVSILACLLTFGRTEPIITIHTNLSVERQYKKEKLPWYKKLLSSLLYKFPTKIVAVSKSVAKDFSDRTTVPIENIKVIYNPAYNPHAPYNEYAQLPLTDSSRLDDKTDYIICVGRLTEAKDFETMIKGFQKVRERVDVKLLILGEGERRSDLEELINQCDLEGEVFLPGYVSNPYYFIKRAKLFVMSSKWEGFGNVIVEALGAGVPVISTNCPGGPSEILENGKYGTLVPVGNADKLAEEILETLKKNPFKPEVLINRAKDFGVEEICDQYYQYIF